MKGKITSIDVSSNVGTLSDDQNNSYNFSLDDCIGFEDIPPLESFVEFGLNDGEIFYLEPIKEEITDDMLKNLISGSSKTSLTPKKSTLKGKKKPYVKKVLDFTMYISKPLEECLEEYFSDVTYSIEEYEASFEDYEELDYLLMKRFLNTAYNNLRDMDSTFMDEELEELYEILKVLDKIYLNLVKKDIIPQVAYEKIFLEKQKDYKSNSHRLQANSSEIFTLESSLKNIQAQIKNFEDKIRQNKVLKEVIEQWQKDVKRYRTYYVDTLHKIALLKEENVVLQKTLEVFANQYKNKFIQCYNAESKNYFGLLRRQLDGYAYVFDKKMWERAENSHSIMAFFKKAHIDEDFSSKTFLKYFIRTLDKNKLSKEMKRLEALLEYLESKAKMRCLIVHENFSELDSVKHCIRRLDKDYVVEDIDKPRTIYYRKDLRVVDFIFIETGMKNPPIEEFLTMLLTRLKQTNSKAKICLVSKKVNKEMILSAKNYKIDHFVSLHVSEKELQETLRLIIESKNA